MKELLDEDGLAAPFEAHLRAMDEVDRREKAWREAVAEEQKLEKRIQRHALHLAEIARARFGADGAKLRDFGLEPRKPPRISVQTKAAAVEKRRETRKRRGTMGRRQRTKVKR
jgi:hypothetical protein